MKQKRIYIFLIFLYTCSPPDKQHELDTLNKGELMNDHFFFSVPYYTSSDSAAIIDVVINDKHFRFMVDTGAPLAISKSLQKEFNFPVLLQGTTTDSNGDTAGVEIVQSSLLEIGKLKFKNIPAVVIDLESQLFDCDHIDGLIGSNLLRLLVVQFNKPERKIYFADNIDSFHLSSSTTSVPLFLTGSQSDPHFVLKLNGEYADTVLFDSGDQTLYTISKYFFDSLNKDGGLDKQIVARGKGISAQGIVASNTDMLNSFLFKTDISLGNDVINNVISKPNYDIRSRVGRNLWSMGTVTMDYVKQKFYFTSYRNDNPFTENNYGFEYGERNGKFVATLVWDSTKAFNCGLKPGDEILQFGNFDPSSVSKCEWKAYCDIEVQAATINIKYQDQDGTIKQCSLEKLHF